MDNDVATLERSDRVIGLKVVSERVIQPYDAADAHFFSCGELGKRAICPFNEDPDLGAFPSIDRSWGAYMSDRVLVLRQAENGAEH